MSNPKYEPKIFAILVFSFNTYPDESILDHSPLDLSQGHHLYFYLSLITSTSIFLSASIISKPIFLSSS